VCPAKQRTTGRMRRQTRGIGSPLHRIKRPDRRQIAVEPFHLRSRDLPRAALSKGRRADIARQHVRIAVDAERCLVLGVHRVVPGAGRELDDAGAIASVT